MCLISVQNFKEIHPGEGCSFWLKVIVLNWCEEEKYGQYSETHNYFKNYFADFLRIEYAKLCIWRT